MATLIQAKQIEGIVTASVIQGDFVVSGQIIATGSESIFSAISSSGPIYGVRYDDIQGTPSFIGGTGILITQVGDNITITNTGGGDGVSGSAELISSVALLNSYTGSNDIIIVGLQQQIDSLIAATSSYETKGRGIISGSDQLTSSLDSRYALSGEVGGGGTSDFTELTNIPSGLVSSSDQILGGTGILSGSHTNISSLNQFTQSIQSQLDALVAETSSYLTSETDSQTLSIVGDQLTISDGNTITIPTGSGSGTSDFTQLTNVPSGLVSGSYVESLPSGLISSSEQVLGGSGILSGSHTDISSLNDYTSSNDTNISQLQSASSSFQSQLDALVAETSSYLTSETDSQTLSIVGDQLTISSGNTITIPTGSNVDLPSGTISSSQQISDLGFIDSAHTDITQLNQFTESIQSEVDSLTAATSSYLTELPSGLVSGSVLRTLDGTSVISSSQQISDLGFVTSSEESPFNGDRVVSNTLFGDLYSESYNAGTSGSLREFIEQVFFPSSAPTATFTTQTANLNTNLATDGTNLESISITDTVDDSPYVVTLGGTNASSLTPVPTNADSSSWELRANGDLTAGTYTYDVTVTDSATATRTYSGRTLTIAQATNGTMSVNGTLYIIESATSGVITLSSTGRPGSTGVVSVSYSPNYGSQVATNFTSSNPLISINSSNGQLSVGSPISGSGNLSGDTITSTISWEDQYGNTDSDTISVNVTTNFAPTHSTTLTTNNNTNQATGSAQIIRLTVTDTESDSIPNGGLVWGDYNSTYFTPSVTSPYMYLSANNTSIPAGVYPFTASFSDVHGFRTSSYSSSVTINQADNGTLGGDINNYIIESALSGSVLRDQTGFNAGNVSQVTVSYSPSYGSPVVTEFTSSRQGISVDSSGNLTAGYDFSGSVTSTDYTSTRLTSDSTNSTLYGQSLYSHGLKIVQGAAVGGQNGVPDLFTEKVAQVVKLMITGSGPDIDDVAQANMIGTLKGESGTWHSGYPTAQRILRGAGSDYSPNPLIDSNYPSYSGLQNFQDTHSTNDMIWYLNSSATPGSGDADITEVMEHLMHTIHLYGVRGGVEGSVNGLSWMPDLDSDWNTRELYLALKEAVDNNVFDISGYGDGDYTTAATFELAAKEYLYLLNFNMWEYSSLWDGGSLSPEWNDNSRTQSGIQTYNPLGYALYNKYIKPVLTKPSLSSLRSIFQDGDVGNPAIAGSSGYTPEVGTGLISKITFTDQYGNVGSGSVTVNVFGNQSPAASFTDLGLNTETAVSGSHIGTLTITDTETNTPFSASIGGTDGGKFEIVPQNANSSSYYVYPTGSLSQGDYSVQFVVTDNYSETATLNETISVSAATDYGTIYVYTQNLGPAGAWSTAQYKGIYGISAESGDTPPEVTSFTAATSMLGTLVNNDVIGDSTITFASTYTMTLRDTISGDTTLDSALASNGNISFAGTANILLLYPSGSDMEVPTSIQESINGTAGGAVPYLNADGGGWGVAGAKLNSITLGTPHLGYSEWFVLGRLGTDGVGSSFEYRLINANGGSAPS